MEVAMSAGRYSVESTDLLGLPGRVLRDEAVGVEVAILDRGAEPVSLRLLDRGSGRWSGHLARDGEVGLASPWQPLHCTHLGLYAHTLIDNQSRYGTDLVRGRGHGFLPAHAHNRIETRVDEGGVFASYRVEPGDYPRELYPRALAFTIEQGLRDGWLEIAYRVENLEPDRPVHVSFGAHPAFPITEPEKFEIRLSPGVYRQWIIDKGVHLTGETREIRVTDGFTFPWTIASLSSPVLLEIVDVPNASVIGLDPVSGLGVEIDLTEHPTINFWSNSPSFVCMEPIWGLPDAAEQRPFDRKHAILEVPVGGVLTRRFRMRPFRA